MLRNPKNPLIGRIMFSLSLVMALATAAFAINNVAVLELLPNQNVEDMISIGESRHLTDELRRQAVITLPASDYSVLTRDNIIALMPPDEKEAECLADGCAVDIGRAIGAEYISQGTIGKFGKKLTISVELYETMGGKLLSSIVFESEDIEGLLGVIRKEAGPLFQKILFVVKKEASPSFQRKPSNIDTGISTSESGIMRTSQWVSIGLDILGAAAIGWGIYQNSQVGAHKKVYDRIPEGSPESDFEFAYKKVDDAKSMRNIGYIAGGVLLASGITIYIFF
jgi:TolB-like protein